MAGTAVSESVEERVIWSIANYTCEVPERVHSYGSYRVMDPNGEQHVWYLEVLLIKHNLSVLTESLDCSCTQCLGQTCILDLPESFIDRGEHSLKDVKHLDVCKVNRTVCSSHSVGRCEKGGERPNNEVRYQ